MTTAVAGAPHALAPYQLCGCGRGVASESGGEHDDSVYTQATRRWQRCLRPARQHKSGQGGGRYEACLRGYEVQCQHGPTGGGAVPRKSRRDQVVVITGAGMARANTRMYGAAAPRCPADRGVDGAGRGVEAASGQAAAERRGHPDYDRLATAARHLKRRGSWAGGSTMGELFVNKSDARLLDCYRGRSGYKSQQTGGARDPRNRLNLCKPADVAACRDFGAYGSLNRKAYTHSVQLWDSQHHGLPARTAGVGAGAAAAGTTWATWRM